MIPKRLSSKDFLYIYNKVPRLCIDLIIKNTKGIVLSKRDIEPYKGQWHLPGGTVLFGETLKKAVKRVVKDETGLNVKVVKILGVIEFTKTPDGMHAISVAIEVFPLSGILRGSYQGWEIDFFKKYPKPSIAEHKSFLIKNKLIK